MKEARPKFMIHSCDIWKRRSCRDRKKIIDSDCWIGWHTIKGMHRGISQVKELLFVVLGWWIHAYAYVRTQRAVNHKEWTYINACKCGEGIKMRFNPRAETIPWQMNLTLLQMNDTTTLNRGEGRRRVS